MAKATDVIEELEGDDEVEETEEETPLGTRPVDLAKELGMSPKVLRAWLRKTYPRDAQDKNKSWYLTEDQVDAAWAHFVDDADETDEVEVDSDEE